MLRRFAFALLALAVASAAQAQPYRSGVSPGFRSGFRFGGGALASAQPLPPVTGGYVVAYGLSKLVSGYAGAALKIQCGATATQIDVGFDGNGYTDVTAAQNVCGAGVEMRVVTLFDQTGGGKHATGSATSPSLLPILTTQKAAYGPAFAARPIILQQGLIYPYTANQVAGLALPSSVSVDKSNVGFLDVAAPNTSLRLNAISNLGNNSGSGRINLVVQTGQTGLGTFVYNSAGTQQATQTAGAASAPRINLQVLGVVSRSSGLRLIAEDISLTGTAQDSATITAGALGGGSGTNSGAYFTGDRFAFVVFSGAATDAEVNAVRSTLSSIVGSTKRTNRIVLLGSSLPEGRGANNLVAGTYSTQSGIRMAMGLLDREVDAWNIAISGRTAVTVRDQAATEADPLILSGANNVAIVDVGGNDIAAGATGSATYAVVKTIAQARKTAGFQKVIVTTLAQRTDITGTTAKENERIAFNNAIKAGQSDIGYDGLIDYDAIPQLQNPGAGNICYQADSDSNYTHPVTACQLLRGQKAAPLIQGVLQ